MNHIILIRHGSTDWNIQYRFQGQSDIPLNEIGLQEANAISRRLKNENINTIYSSDLKRAQETAQIIARYHQDQIVLDPKLREIDFGDWEGLTYKDIQQRDPDRMAAWQSGKLNVSPPGGESLNQLDKRVKSCSDKIKLVQTDESIVVVSHGGPLRVMLCQALNLSPDRYWQFRLARASYSDLTGYSKGAILNTLNDTCHLNRLNTTSY